MELKGAKDELIASHGHSGIMKKKHGDYKVCVDIKSC
jgi:hypothetical protein